MAGAIGRYERGQRRCSLETEGSSCSGGQPPECVLRQGVADSAKSDGQTFAGGTVGAVERATQDLLGDMEPRSTVGRESRGTGLKPGEKLGFVPAQHVRKVRRTSARGDDGKTVASGFKPQSKSGGAFANFDGGVHTSSAAPSLASSLSGRT